MATDWRIVGEEFGTCNCDWGCPCQFNANPTQGWCMAVVGFRIDEGHFGDTSLDRVNVVCLFRWPGAIHEGNGTRQIIIDEAAGDDQAEAVEALFTGQHGGAIFEIFSAVCPDTRETARAPVVLESDREARIGRISVPGFAEANAEPIKNPVDGSEHRARIDLPDGFEYKIAEVGNTVKGEATAEEPLTFSFENSYAQFNAFEHAAA